MSTVPQASPLTILIAEDDDGHAELIRMTLRDAGLTNPIERFEDGQQILDYLYGHSADRARTNGHSYLLLLDIRMPKVDGEQVLEKVKADPELCKLPVVMLTTTDDPQSIEKCYRLGCSCFITKPLDMDHFFDVLRRLGLFIQVVAVPRLNIP